MNKFLNINNYKLVLKLLFNKTRLFIKGEGLSPFSRVFVNKKYKILVCLIEKAASSSTRKWLLAMEPKVKSHVHEDFKCNINQNIYQCSAKNLKHIKNIFWGSDVLFYRFQTFSTFFKKLYFKKYYKIVFVRNPWSRLVSAYLSKFCGFTIKQLPAAQEAAKYIYNKYNLDKDKMFNYNEPGGITFKQFVEYLKNLNDIEKMDPHWRPQYTFLEEFKYDFIGKIENQNENIDFLKSKFNITEEYPHLTSHNYAVADTDSYNLYPYELNKIRDDSGGYPNYKNFYNKDLIKLVANIYKKDIELFDYKFED